MAREESDREDLLRDATALVERIEFAPAEASGGEHVVIGFRSVGAMSVYFGTDAAYHFNSSGQLRRAFYNVRLVKAERGRLVALERVRRGNEVQLLRQHLSDEQQRQFLATMMRRLGDLVQRLAENSLVAVGQVPAEADVLGRARGWLANCRDVVVAHSPRVQ